MEFLKSGLTTLPSRCAAPLLSLQQQQKKPEKENQKRDIHCALENSIDWSTVQGTGTTVIFNHYPQAHLLSESSASDSRCSFMTLIHGFT